MHGVPHVLKVLKALSGVCLYRVSILTSERKNADGIVVF